MTSELARAKLARAALVLNARSGYAGILPALVLMTDERLADPRAAVRALPKGSTVIVRARKARARAEVALMLSPLARESGLVLLIAGDPPLADALRADGLHLPEARLREAAHWRTRRPHWLITVAAHSARALRRAAQVGAHAALLSPVFPTASQPSRASLGPMRFLMMAKRAPLPVYALGGVNAGNTARLAHAHAAGIVAVDALKVVASDLH